MAGIPARVLEVFSKRRQEIEVEMEAAGLSGPKAAAQVTLDTRPAHSPVDPSGLDDRWIAEAGEVGFTPDDLDAILTGTHPTASGMVVLVDDPDTGEPREQRIAVEDLPGLVAGQLAASDAVFVRHQVTATISQLCPGGVTVDRLERLTALVLTDSEFVSLPTVAGVPAGEQRWTTRTLLGLESDLIDAFTPTPTNRWIINRDVVDRVLADHTELGPDQVDTVRRLTSQGLGVEVVVGRAGTGKTHTMNTVRAVFEAAGYRLVGVAPSALAARGLTAGAGMEAFTLPRFTRHVVPTLDERTVVVVDEAGMASTGDLRRTVIAAHAAGAKVVLVGDHHQLPEIGAGGGFATAVNLTGNHLCELTVNRRQTETWEQTALDELRHGNITTVEPRRPTHRRRTRPPHRARSGDRGSGVPSRRPGRAHPQRHPPNRPHHRGPLPGRQRHPRPHHRRRSRHWHHRHHHHPAHLHPARRRLHRLPPGPRLRRHDPQITRTHM